MVFLYNGITLKVFKLKNIPVEKDGFSNSSKDAFLLSLFLMFKEKIISETEALSVGIIKNDLMLKDGR